MDWVLRGHEEPDFRKQLAFAKPKVAWKKFDMPVTKDGVLKHLEGLHPAHKAKILFERIAILFTMAPSEVVLLFAESRRQISYGSVDEQHLSDLGFVSYCHPDAEIPTLVVKEKERVDDIVRDLHGNRDAADEDLKNMWFW